jgi:hypothetical protein
VLDASLLRSEPRREFQKPRHPIPQKIDGDMLPQGETRNKNI